jgi:acyl-coenzyme A synthetase/AMP-(fatty) acid ligase
MVSSFYILRQLFTVAQVHPQKVAIVLDDQVWTYSELIEGIELITCHLHRLGIVQGQIIYQFVERSFEMICGLFGIMCAGGVYCPVIPTTPAERIVSLFQQLQGQYVLLHEKTRKKFPSTIVLHVVLSDKILLSSLNAEDVSDLPLCRECGYSFIICTSGTTGRPKATIHTHSSFSAGIGAFLQWELGIYTFRDQVLQVAACTWAMHLIEIASSLVVGGTLVLLRPDGQLDMAYFSQTILRQQVTTLTMGPGIMRALTNHFEISQRFASVP